MALSLLLLLLLPASHGFPLQPSETSFDVIEESPLDTVIHGVSEHLNRIIIESVEMPNSTIFQLMGMDPITKCFAINPKSGELRVTSRVDREEICRSDSAQPGTSSIIQHPIDSFTTGPCIKTINVNIRSKSAGGSSETSQKQPIILRIVDINDNSPVWFGKSSLSLRFLEVSQSSAGLVGKHESNSASQLIDRATDPDEGINGTLTYALKGPGAEMFRLENGDPSNTGYSPHETLSFSGPLVLRPLAPLDREVVAFYNLTLYAFDSGQPQQRSSSIPLHVYITDVNDHAPVFHSHHSSDHSTSYAGEEKHGDLVKYTPPRGHLLESAHIESLVLQLNATDQDYGDNGRVTYSIPPSDAALASYFSLDPVSGHLKVKRKLDYDSGPRRFKFKVIAMDGAPEPYRLTGAAVVDIELTDVNDEPPNIDVLIPNQTQRQSQNGKQQELVAYIEETPSPDLVIAYVTVSDKDENGEDQVHCQLGPRDNFTLHPDPFNGPPVGNFDYSFGSHAPVAGRIAFREYRILAKVPAAASSGHILTNNQIGGGGGGLQTFLDRETTPTQILTITCTDRAGNRAEKKIRVNLLDINDNAPKFANDSYFNFVVAENREPVSGQPVWLGRVHAADSDLGDNAKVTYKLSPDQQQDAVLAISTQQMFMVKSESGDVYAQIGLDRETAPKNGVYSMTVIATDQSKTTRLTGTARIDVTVLDVNDCSPEFTQDIYNFNTPEDVDLQESIGTVEAIDRDKTAAPNTITYHLNILRSTTSHGIVQRSISDRVKRDSGNQPLFVPQLEPSKLRDHRPLSYFSIDSRTGEIRVIRKLDRELTGYFAFEVLAVDSPLAASSAGSQLHRTSGGGEVFTATATVFVTVTDVNDNSPEFRYPNASIRLHMAPGETLGHKIITVQATDPDDGENARISYSIRSEIPVPTDGPGTGHFAIDESSGLIFLTRPIHGPVNHHLVIEACDHGTVPKCTSSPSIQVAILEDAKIGTGQQRGRIGIPGDSSDGIDSAGSDRFNYNAFYSGTAGGFDNGQGTPHRVEVIAACLVVVFGVMLFAVVVVACLLKKRPRGQLRNGSQERQYACTLGACKWRLFRQQKSPGKLQQQDPQYISARGPENLVDPRFSDDRSLELSKGMSPGDTLDVRLDEETKKPFFYDEIGMLTSEGMVTTHVDGQPRLVPMSPSGLPITRPLRHPQMVYAAPPTSAMVFAASASQAAGPHRLYGTIPVISEAARENGAPSAAMATLMTRQAFQPTIGRPVKLMGTIENAMTPPSPDYQSLDQVASGQARGNSGWQPQHQFFTTPTKTPINARQSSSYGCLIDTGEAENSTSRQPRQVHNYYEINPLVTTVDDGFPRHYQRGGSQKMCQRSATLGRLVMMEESAEDEDVFMHCAPGGVLSAENNSRSYSHLQAISCLNDNADESGGVDRDKPTRYTYQAMREASFV